MGRQINARFAAMAGHYLFEPEFCNPVSGWDVLLRRHWFEPNGAGQVGRNRSKPMTAPPARPAVAPVAITISTAPCRKRDPLGCVR